MCRLLGMISKGTRGLDHWLVDAQNALREQSHEHPHGWGIAAFSTGAWTLSRQPKPAHEDEQFVREARAARGSTFVTHIRKASRGEHTLVNTHPFLRHGWAFAHNGTLVNATALRAEIDFDLLPRGQTDSEALFRLILTELRRACDDYPSVPPGQVCRCLLEIVPRLESKKGTCFLLSDGARLFFYREGHTLRSLRLDGAGAPMLLVASEPIDDDEWTDLPDAEGFVADTTPDVRTWAQVAETSEKRRTP